MNWLELLLYQNWKPFYIYIKLNFHRFFFLEQIDPNNLSKLFLHPQTHQQRHDELVQVNHLDAAHIQLQSAISFGCISIGCPLGSVRHQTHCEAENLVTNDRHDLNDRKSSLYSIRPKQSTLKHNSLAMKCVLDGQSSIYTWLSLFVSLIGKQTGFMLFLQHFAV